MKQPTKTSVKLHKGGAISRVQLMDAERTGGSARALVVDNERNFALLIQMRLEDHGLDVIPAYDGPKALSKFGSEGPFDVVFTDRAMPTMDGETLIAKLKEINPDIKIVMLSALELSEADRARIGADKYLLKTSKVYDELGGVLDELGIRREKV